MGGIVSTNTFHHAEKGNIELTKRCIAFTLQNDGTAPVTLNNGDVLNAGEILPFPILPQDYFYADNLKISKFGSGTAKLISRILTV